MARTLRPFFLLALAALACGAPESSPPPTGQVNAVLIEKAAHRLTLLSNGRAVRTYAVALGRRPVGPKVQEGDNRTPEGSYVIDRHNAASAFHLALHISYPNASDMARASKLGVSAGGDIMIHGLRNGFGWLGPSHRLLDWTRGCIAVTNSEIDEIARLVSDGTPVEIKP